MSRFLVPLLVAAFVVAVVVVAVLAFRQIAGSDAAPAIEPARWTAAHVSRDGLTHVVVRRVVASTGQVLDEREVVTFPDDDPDYDARFMEAIATARARADLFNGEDR